MKFIPMLIMILCSMACAYTIPDNNTPAGQLGQAIFGLLLLGTFSGAIPITIVILVIMFGQGSVKTAKKVLTTDYTEIPEEKKQDMMAEELKKAYKEIPRKSGL